MNKSKSLIGQLLIGNTIIFTFLLFCMGSLIFFISYKTQVQNIENDNRQLIEMISERVRHYVDTPVQMIDELRNQVVFNESMSDIGVVDTYFNTLLKVYPYIEQIKLINEKGEIITVAPFDKEMVKSSVKFETYFQERPKNNKIIWSNVYISPLTQKPTVTITAKAGAFTIVGDLNLSMMEVLVDAHKIPGLLSLSILDEYGTFLMDSNTSNVEQRLTHPDFEKLELEEAGGGRLIPSSNDQNVLLTSVKVGEENNWHLVISEDKKVIYGSLSQIIYTLLLGLAIIAAVTFGFLFLNLQKVVKDIKCLVRSTLFISEGHYDRKIDESSFTELQELADHFGIMVDHISTREEEIKQINVNLEKIIEERTNQLKFNNYSLEEMNAQLEEEVMERQRVEDELLYLNQELENKVRIRTADLEVAFHDLEIAKGLADDAALSKSQFLANMSHEIRTPMNGIIGMIGILAMTELNKEQQGYLRTVRASADTLLTILNDILDYSKIEAGKVQIELKSFDLNNMVNDVSNLFLASARHRNISIRTIIDDRIPKIVIGDENRIRQILSNLVGNAIKFTIKGHVELNVSLSSSLEYRSVIRFDVKDTGIGIDEEDMKNIFDRFTQFSHYNGKKTNGTGLGLAISKMLTELMGGEIFVQSKIGVGSCFSIILELEEGQGNNQLTTAVEEVQLISPLNDLKGLKFLVAEDDATSRFMMTIILNKLNAQVLSAEDGLQAIDILSHEIVDMVLMDVNMPKMDGLSATEELRKLEVTNRVGEPLPIIAMTAYAMTGDKEKCLNAGMTDYLSKPIELEQLLEKIQKYGGAKLMADFIDVDANEFEANEFEATVVEVVENNNMSNGIYLEIVDDLIKASGFNESMCRYVLRTYVDQSLELLKMIKSIQLKLEDGDIGNLLHKLKGSSGNVRANRVMALALETEAAYKEEAYDKVKRMLSEIELILLDLDAALLAVQSIGD